METLSTGNTLLLHRKLDVEGCQRKPGVKYKSKGVWQDRVREQRNKQVQVKCYFQGRSKLNGEIVGKSI